VLQTRELILRQKTNGKNYGPTNVSGTANFYIKQIELIILRELFENYSNYSKKIEIFLYGWKLKRDKEVDIK